MTLVTMKPRDLSAVLKDATAGDWVALSSDKTKIVGQGRTMEEASNSARLAGAESFTLVKVPLPHVGIAASL